MKPAQQARWMLLLAASLAAFSFIPNGRSLPTKSVNRAEARKPGKFESPDHQKQQPFLHKTWTASNFDTVYSENFDSGAPGWTFQDLWSEVFWHVSTTGAFSGSSYWCGIEKLGGYDDRWIQTLTSPAINLSGATQPTLTFMHDYRVEPPENVGLAGYNAWDAVNVRISTDGNTFNVIEPVSGYSHTSAYGFHFYYGIGVKGWAGTSGGYVQATFDLSAFAGQTIWLRFEFGSDEGFSHEDDPNLFGWRIDNIAITDGATAIFSDDAGDTGPAQFVADGLGGPSLWHFTTAAAVSAPNSVGCFDPGTEDYLPRMNAALVSPPIALDAVSPISPELIPDFQVRGVIDATLNSDPGSFDFFIAEARGYKDGAWSHWVFSGLSVLPASFTSYNDFIFDTFGAQPLNASAFAGNDSLQLRFVVLTAPDNQVLSPANVFVDNFTLSANSFAAFRGSLKDSITNAAISAKLEFIYNKAPEPLLTISTNPDGSFEVSVPVGLYDIIITPELPYPRVIHANLGHESAGTQLDTRLKPAQMLLVEDDSTDVAVSSISRVLNQMRYEHAVWNPMTQGGAVPSEKLQLLAEPRILFWATGTTNSNPLTPADRSVIMKYLDNGNALILTGENIAETAPPTDSLMSLYLGVQFIRNFSRPFIQGFARDPIGDGIVTNATGNSKDQLQLNAAAITQVNRVFYYGNTAADTANIAAIRVQNEQEEWRAVFFGFGLESVGVARQSTVIARTINWLIVTAPVNVDEGESAVLPVAYVLEQNYPNPFNPSTVIGYSIATPLFVKLKVYDVLGHEVATLVNERKAAGKYQASFETGKLASGIYLYRLEAGEFVEIKKMLLVR